MLYYILIKKIFKKKKKLQRPIHPMKCANEHAKETHTKKADNSSCNNMNKNKGFLRHYCSSPDIIKMYMEAWSMPHTHTHTHTHTILKISY